MNITKEAMQQFELFGSPFQGDCQSPEEIYYSVEHHYVKAVLEQSARVMGCLTAIIGEVGSGKTTVTNDFIERAQDEGIVVIQPYMLDKTQITAQHIAEAVIHGLDPTAKLRLSREARARQLAQALQDSTKAGRKHVLVIEEAQDLPVMVLKILKRLVEIKYGNKSSISVVMISQPEFLIRLDSSRNYHLRELINRTTVAEIAPIGSPADIKDYLSVKFPRAAQIFSPDSYEAIGLKLTEVKNKRPQSAAYPLSINNLIVRALNSAASIGLPMINAQIIQEA